MKLLAQILLLAVVSLSLSISQAADAGYDSKPGKFVRVSNNDDGSRTVFQRYPGDMELHKKTYDPEGRLIHKAVYKTNNVGAMMGCYIHDGKGNILFKVAYVYDRLGRLVQEYMYEADTEALVSIFEYPEEEHDANGKKVKPKCIVVKKGKDPDNRFRFAQPTKLDKDPFAEDEKKPKGKAVKR